MKTNSLLLEYGQASDTLVVALGKPSGALRLTYYCLLALLCAAALWASLSIIDITVYAPATIRPQFGVQNLTGAASGRLVQVYAVEHHWVHAGDTLAVVEDVTLHHRYRLAQEKLLRISGEIDDLKALYNLDSTARFLFPLYAHELQVRLQERRVYMQDLQVLRAKLQRQQELYDKKFASSEEYEHAKAEWNQKELVVRQWQHTTTRGISERIQQMELQRLELQSELSTLTAELGKLVLRAPADGYISGLAFKKPGVMLKAGDVFCTLSPQDTPCVELYLTPKDIGYVKEGLEIRYQIDAFPFQEWGIASGVVSSVAQDCIFEDKTALFKVKANIRSTALTSARTGKQAHLKTGMTCRAGIVVAQKRLITMLWDKTIDYFAL